MKKTDSSHAPNTSLLKCNAPQTKCSLTSAIQYVVLEFYALDGSFGEYWALLITIPLEKWVSGTTLELNETIKDFEVDLFYEIVNDRWWREGFGVSGTIILETATEPGVESESSGSFEIELLGFKAELSR